MSKKAQKLVDDAAALAEQAAELKQQAEAEAAIRQQQLDEIASQQAGRQKELELTAQEQADIQKKLDNRDKSQRRFTKFIRELIQEFGGNDPARFTTYAEAMAAVKAAKENFVDTTTAEAKQKAQEETAAEFQHKEDALEAQREVLDELEKLRDRMQSSIDTDTSRKRFMETHRTSGRTLEEIYQAGITKKREQDKAFIRQAANLTAEYDAAHRTYEQLSRQVE